MGVHTLIQTGASALIDTGGGRLPGAAVRE